MRYLDKGGTLIVAGGNLGQICYVPYAYTTLQGSFIRDSWHTKRQYCKNTHNCNINWSSYNTKLCGWCLPPARHEFCFHSQTSIMNFTVICLNLHNWRSRRLFFFKMPSQYRRSQILDSTAICVLGGVDTNHFDSPHNAKHRSAMYSLQSRYCIL